jgi:hypothetical protein
VTRVLIILFIAVAATLVPPAGRATGGRYAFVGGTPRERAEVTRALHASSFDWNLVPRIAIHIAPVASSYATPGEIWLDPDLLAAGSFAWVSLAWVYWPSPENVMRVASTRGFSPVRFRGLVNRILSTEGAR